MGLLTLVAFVAFHSRQEYCRQHQQDKYDKYRNADRFHKQYLLERDTDLGFIIAASAHFVR